MIIIINCGYETHADQIRFSNSLQGDAEKLHMVERVVLSDERCMVDLLAELKNGRHFARPAHMCIFSLVHKGQLEFHYRNG